MAPHSTDSNCQASHAGQSGGQYSARHVQGGIRRGQCCHRGSATSPKTPDLSISSRVGLSVAELLPCFIDRSEEDLDPFHTTTARTAMPVLRRLDPAVGKIRRCGVAVSKIPDLWVRQSLASHSTELWYLVPMRSGEQQAQSDAHTTRQRGMYVVSGLFNAPRRAGQFARGLDESFDINGKRITCAEPRAVTLLRQIIDQEY